MSERLTKRRLSLRSNKKREIAIVNNIKRKVHELNGLSEDDDD